MPSAAMVSAVSRTTFSLRTLQANLFQLFQPMGGVRARPLSRAWAVVVAKRATKNSRINQVREPLRCMQNPFLRERAKFTQRHWEGKKQVPPAAWKEDRIIYEARCFS